MSSLTSPSTIQGSSVRPEPQERPIARVWREYRRSKLAVVGLSVILALIAIALFAPFFSPQDPYDLAQLDFRDGRLAPGNVASNGQLTYLLGTDDQGRDMLSGIMYGLRTSLGIGFASAFIACIVGTLLGMTAAYFGGRTDSLIMRVVDLHLSFPAILVALMILAALGKSITNVMLAIVIVEWAYYARTVRGSALVERRKEYIEAAQGLGLSSTRILLRHMLPNCLPPLIVVFTLQVARAISLEATLSFLGLGVPITEPSLGLLISNGFQYMFSGEYWIMFYPGITLMMTIVAINLVGDQLRDALNPRLQR